METKILSRYAVFSKLYDEKKNVYDVIREFIYAFLSEKRLYEFNLTDFVGGFNNYYNFNLPSAVLKSSLKHIDFIKIQEGVYQVDYSKFPEKKYNYFNSKSEDTDFVFQKLIGYCEEEFEHTLSSLEKDKLLDDLYRFLLKNTCSSKNLTVISSFLIKNENNERYKTILNEIKEGLIIYEGITTDLEYSQNDINKHGSWQTEMTMYLNMEILFHIVGYNGEYFKQHADDFISFVREINRQKKLISLRFFKETEKDIDSFFYAAEHIVETGKLEEEKTAMKSIINGCKSRSEVAAKKTAFFDYLKNYGIEKELKDDFYDEKNFKYNIEDSNAEINHFLNYINILRKGQNTKKFADVKYLFITADSEIIKKAFEIKQEKDFSLASTLDYVTEHFWFILNKGFGTERSLKSFDVIGKAKMVLSNLISENISQKYAELNKKYTDGEITLDEVKSLIVDLRNDSRLPEEINTNEVDFILNLLSHEDINDALEEKAMKERKLEQIQEENEKTNALIADMKKNDSKKDLELERLKSENEALKRKEEKRKLFWKRILKVLLLLLPVVIGLIVYKFIPAQKIRVSVFVGSIYCVMAFIKFIYPKIKSKIPNYANAIAIIASILGFFGINIESVIKFVKDVVLK